MHTTIVRPGDATAEPVDICIVIDVVRATTTAAVLCDRLGELCVVRALADLIELPERPAGYALFSELADRGPEWPRFDNSPVQARSASVDGRMPVLVTTNGTLAVGVAAGFAREVLLGGFVNLTAIDDYVRGRAVARVALMPAGNVTTAQRCAEDDGCAEALLARLSDHTVDIAGVSATCRSTPRLVAREAREPTLAADLELCFAVDALSVVPRIAGGSDRRWFGVAAGPRRSITTA